jgi:hypothetical protein
MELNEKKSMGEATTAYTLCRLDLDYSVLEDRMRVRGDTSCDRRVELWLTRRLSRNLLPKLEDLVKPMLAQEKCSITPENKSVLITEVDINLIGDFIRLVLKNDTKAVTVSIDFEPRVLMIWVEGLRGLYEHADWGASQKTAINNDSKTLPSKAGLTLH